MNAPIVFELQRESQGNYEGRWYYIGNEFVAGRSGKTVLRRVGMGHYSDEKLNEEIISAPESDLQFE